MWGSVPLCPPPGGWSGGGPAGLAICNDLYVCDKLLIDSILLALRRMDDHPERSPF